MVEAIKELIVQIFGNASWLGIIIIAMIPIVELRGAIPFALSTAVWGASALSWWQAYICAVVGSTIPALVIVPLLIPFFNWMKKTKTFKKIAEAFEKMFTSKSQNLVDKVNSEVEVSKKNKLKFWGVVTFVAIPFPLTGAWTGSAVSAYINLGFTKSIFAILLGNVISGGIMTLLCTLFNGFEDIILYCFLGLVVLVLIGAIVWTLCKKNVKVSEKI